MDSKQKERRSAPQPPRRATADGTRKAAPTTRKTAPAETGKPAVKKQPAAQRPQTAPRQRTEAAQPPRKQPAQRPANARTQTVKKPSTAPKAQENTRATADVVYLPPKPFSRNRLLLRLATVTAVVLALLFGISIFFKVDKIVVSGTDKYTAWDVSQAAEILGDNLLTFSHAEACGKIQLALPYVDQVRIGIKLPDTVKIDIVEIEVTYAIQDQNNSWWLISSGGKVVEKAATGAEEGYTKLLGVRLDSPVAGEKAAALEVPSTETDAEGNPIPVTITEAKQLNTALDIAQYLELNGIIGKAASVDVTNMADIQLWYEQRYQVQLGDESQLSYKISCLKSIVDASSKYEGGVLDISFTLDPDRPIYTPFS